MSASARPAAPIDLVVNCFERTYRHVLAPGFFPKIENENRTRFACRTAVINNVDDREDATAMAKARIDAGEIDRFVFVSDRSEAALAQVGLTREDLGAAPWFSEWAYVAVTLDGPEFVLLWDADVRLVEAYDWLTPALDLLGREPRVLVANPTAVNERHLARQWTFDHIGDFALSYGCSDQVMLARRADLARPIYRERTLSRLRFPLAHVSYIFEARIDSYLRRHDRVRATHTKAAYEHVQEAYVSYPHRPWRERVQLFADQALIWSLRHSPVLPRHLKHM